ncbi:hypothetical protein Tco_0745837, partial [Tanacetum coccineum]
EELYGPFHACCEWVFPIQTWSWSGSFLLGARRYLLNWRLNDLLSLSFTATLDGTRAEVSLDGFRFQLIPSSSSTLLLSLGIVVMPVVVRWSTTL